MKTIHQVNEKRREEKAIKPDSFLLSNRTGDYIWIKDYPQSRYEGWFCNINKNLYRIIESISIDNKGKLIELINGFSYVKKRWENITEIFYLEKNKNTLVYELDHKEKIDIFFDMRTAYSSDNPIDYTVKKRGSYLIVAFNNGLFLAVRCEKGKEIKKIISRHYQYDEKRNSAPFCRNIFHGLSLFGKNFVFAIANSEEKALKNASQTSSEKTINVKEKEIDTICAKNALHGLISYKEEGIFAGFPWFFHFWQRDEAISLKAAMEVNKEISKDVFMRLLKTSLSKGPLGAVNIDAVGWVFKRAEDFLPILSKAEKEKTKRELKKYIEESLWAFTENDFAINKKRETWMDSLDRDGARIEIQAMRLNMYKLAAQLSKRNDEKRLYKEMEEKLHRKTKNAFFDGVNLYDGYCPRKKITEKIIRPNIFIAAYIYPKLLSKKEWLTVFDNALKELWLDWGGIATLSKNNKQFHKKHTGEVSASYHQGDSWFYINNLVAIILYRFHKKKYRKYIKKIMEASKEEILWRGAVGCHAEVSSAEKIESGGCVNQAWSNAMYLEAKKEIKF